ncbi:MAG: hypothetical protein EAS52_10730 [Parapedobacter sp.]|nr:MAG: hypothetical protein EAS52_10730 [Parapedobacter sp.]
MAGIIAIAPEPAEVTEVNLAFLARCTVQRHVNLSLLQPFHAPCNAWVRQSHAVSARPSTYFLIAALEDDLLENPRMGNSYGDAEWRTIAHRLVAVQRREYGT